MVPLGLAFAVALLRQDLPAHEAVAEATAGVVTLVPEGLILLTSLAYAVSTLRMSRRGALAQQLSAIESLSSADVLCLDKTGTLTEDALRLVDTVPAEGHRAGGPRRSRRPVRGVLRRRGPGGGGHRRGVPGGAGGAGARRGVLIPPHVERSARGAGAPWCSGRRTWCSRRAPAPA